MSFARNANPLIYQASVASAIWISIPKLSLFEFALLNLLDSRGAAFLAGCINQKNSGEGEIFTKSTWCTSSAGSAGSATVLWAYGKMDIKTSTSILMVPHDPTVYRCFSRCITLWLFDLHSHGMDGPNRNRFIDDFPSELKLHWFWGFSMAMVVI